MLATVDFDNQSIRKSLPQPTLAVVVVAVGLDVEGAEAIESGLVTFAVVVAVILVRRGLRWQRL